MTNTQDVNNFDGLVSSNDIRTGFISGATFKNKPVQYSVVDGLAIFEGCIVLGTVEEMEAKAAAVRAGEELEVANDRGVFVVGEQFRWTNGVVPYEIDGNLPNQKRISDAIAHWEAKTSIRFVRRTSGNANQYPNYIYFKPDNGCWSYVGMRGGKQEIGLGEGCGLGATIHEIGHALGLWHEQSREDRDRHIHIHWENIKSDHRHNFNQHITDGDDHGNYDYDSIMHYHEHAFAIDRSKPTITPIDPNKDIGQREGLSSGDIATIEYLYQGAAPNARPYTIQAGDTLFLVAQRELGDGNRWREIMKTPNGGTFTEEEASNLHPGQVVYLPLS
jgi:astacin